MLSAKPLHKVRIISNFCDISDLCIVPMLGKDLVLVCFSGCSAPGHSRCSFSPASPMSRWFLVLPAPVHCKGSQSALVHHKSKYRHVALAVALQSTIVACYDARDTFQCSRVFYSWKLPSIFLRYVPILFKYCIYSASMSNDYAYSLNLCHLSTSVAKWYCHCRICSINLKSGSWKARYVFLQLSRNVYLRHDFRARQVLSYYF